MIEFARWLTRRLTIDGITEEEMLWLAKGCPDSGDEFLNGQRATYIANLLDGYRRRPDCPSPTVAGWFADAAGELAGELVAAEDEYEQMLTRENAYVDHLRRQ